MKRSALCLRWPLLPVKVLRTVLLVVVAAAEKTSVSYGSAAALAGHLHAAIKARREGVVFWGGGSGDMGGRGRGEDPWRASRWSFPAGITDGDREAATFSGRRGDWYAGDGWGRGHEGRTWCTDVDTYNPLL
jgi:hypothetical protein